MSLTRWFKEGKVNRREEGFHHSSPMFREFSLKTRVLTHMVRPLGRCPLTHFRNTGSFVRPGQPRERVPTAITSVDLLD